MKFHQSSKLLKLQKRILLYCLILLVTHQMITIDSLIKKNQLKQNEITNKNIKIKKALYQLYNPSYLLDCITTLTNTQYIKYQHDKETRFKFSTLIDDLLISEIILIHKYFRSPINELSINKITNTIELSLPLN